MRIAIFGSTGFIGTPLVQALEARQHSVIRLDLRRDGDWGPKLKGVDAVVNLAGAPVFGKRWNPEYKKLIHYSRIEGTRRIVAALGKLSLASGKMPVLLNGSAIGFYGSRGDEELDEASAPGKDFLAQVCRDWEAAALEADKEGIRTIPLRTGVVLGRKGGALEQILPPFKMYVGGSIGSGKQWFSWIHLDDVVGIIVHLLENTIFRGAFNLTAPNPVRYADFAKTLGKVLQKPSFMTVPDPALKLMVGEAADVLLASQKVLPKRALASGYVYKFPELEAALKDCCGPLTVSPPGGPQK